MQRMMIFLFLLLFIPVSGWAEVNWFLKRFPDFDACEGCVENCTEADIKRYCRVDLNSNSYTDEEYKSLIQEMINKDGRIFDFRIRNVITMLYRHVYEHPEDKRFNELKEYLYEKDVLMGLWRLDGIIQYIPDSLSYYREIITYVLSRAGSNLQYLSKEQRDDEAFVLAAISENKDMPITQYQGNNIEYASEKIRNNKTIAIIAIQNSMQGYAYGYLSKELQQDPEIKKSVEISKNQFLKSSRRQ